MILQVLAPLVRINRQSARNAGQKGGGEQPLNALEFDRLVQKYQSLVYTICRQLVADEGYAQDLTQETFLSAWRSMDRCPAGYEKQWLARFLPGLPWLVIWQVLPAAGLILLGCEVLYYSARPGACRCDFGSVVLCLLMMGGCFGVSTLMLLAQMLGRGCTIHL